jgi:UDP-N-acetylglucosamine acyltransferase
LRVIPSSRSGVVISGAVVIHQFSESAARNDQRLSAVNRDIPPFVIAGGARRAATGLNTVGLRRRGHAEARTRLKMVQTCTSRAQRSPRARGDREGEMTPEIRHFVEFVKGSKRGVCRYAEWAETRD